MIRVTENLPLIRDLLAQAAIDAGRAPDSVKLLAVSKRQPLDAVLAAAAAGQRDFGENTVQEGVVKRAASGRDDLVWHFIGHLQSNKSRLVAEQFDWVHSVDRVKLARRLSKQRPDSMPDLNICLQVNIDSEAAKSGFAPAEVLAAATEIAALDRLRLRGLMCLPAIRTTFEAQREPFARLRELAGELHDAAIATDTLSMGMSGDYRAAIFEGATMVRIGTAVFGPRA